VSSGIAEQRLATMYKEVVPDPMRRADIRVRLSNASRGVSDAREPLQQPVVLGFALVGVLLLVASANTGGLLLARFTSRSGEFGVRIAVGAGRARLMRQLIAESLLLAVLAATAGLLVARVAAPVLLGLIPLGPEPLDFDLRFDWRLAGFTAGLAAVAGLIAGGAPLFRLFQADAAAILTQNTRSVARGRRRLTEILIAAQVACSLLLLVAAGGMTRTLVNLGRVNPGFDVAGVLAITVDAAGHMSDDPSLRTYYAQLHERIASVPQIARVTSAQFGIMTDAATTGTVEIAGWSPVSDDDGWVQLFWIGPDFFEVLRMPIVAGSSIGRHEMAGAESVAVVNQAFAESYFGGVASAVGRTVNRNVRIVGVTADAYYGTLRDEPVRAMFIPYTQAPTRAVRTFLARTNGDTSGAIASVMAAIREHDSRLKVEVTTLSDQIAATLSRERFVAVLAVILSGLALVLSCAGLYAGVAYSVSERRRELAVRLALGATGGDIVRLVLRSPLRVTVIGLILGIPGAYLFMRAVAALLFGVRPFDPATIAACGAGLVAIAAVAALMPARRAAAVDPQECFKCT
jgi:predicted permease